MTIQEEERAIAYFQHGLTIAHVRVALTLASIILQGITLIYQLGKGDHVSILKKKKSNT